MKSLLKIAALALLLPVSTHAVADGEAEYNYRAGIMVSVRGHMASMAAILRGRVHAENFAVHARGMRDMAGIMPNVFPEGSDIAKSESLPAIWENPDDFKAAMDRFVEAANEMAEVAEAGDMSKVPPALGKLGRSCKGCHDDFRKES